MDISPDLIPYSPTLRSAKDKLGPEWDEMREERIFWTEVQRGKVSKVLENMWMTKTKLGIDLAGLRGTESRELSGPCRKASP